MASGIPPEQREEELVSAMDHARAAGWKIPPWNFSLPLRGGERAYPSAPCGGRGPRGGCVGRAGPPRGGGGEKGFTAVMMIFRVCHCHSKPPAERGKKTVVVNVVMRAGDFRNLRTKMIFGLFHVIIRRRQANQGSSPPRRVRSVNDLLSRKSRAPRGGRAHGATRTHIGRGGREGGRGGGGGGGGAGGGGGGGGGDAIETATAVRSQVEKEGSAAAQPTRGVKALSFAGRAARARATIGGRSSVCWCCLFAALHIKGLSAAL